jgi:hypothetical protein
VKICQDFAVSQLISEVLLARYKVCFVTDAKSQSCCCLSVAALRPALGVGMAGKAYVFLVDQRRPQCTSGFNQLSAGC